MQIHELNNFTGTLGSGAYLAIDDGNDTGKISSQGLLAATEARIDNIIAGPAPSAEEIVDARLGDDGVTYPSLGDAIRDQFSDLKSDFNASIGIEEVNFFNSYTKIKNTYVNGSGVIKSSTGDHVAWVKLLPNSEYKFYVGKKSNTDMNIAFFSQVPAVNVGGTFYKTIGTTPSTAEEYFKTNSTDVYLAFKYYTSSASPRYTENEVLGSISIELTSEIEKLIVKTDDISIPVLRNGSAGNEANVSCICTKYVQKIEPTWYKCRVQFIGDKSRFDEYAFAFTRFKGATDGMTTTAAMADAGITKSSYNADMSSFTKHDYLDIVLKGDYDHISFFIWGKKNGSLVAMRTLTDQYSLKISYMPLSADEDIKYKVSSAKHVVNNQIKPLTLMHFSDIHADIDALKRITYQTRNLFEGQIDDMICTGDISGNEASQIASWWDADVLTCIGNHDTASYSGGVYDWTALSMADRDAYYIAPFESNWGITHTSGTSYYYKDYTTEKVRMIVMDVMLYNDNGAEATAQTAWLTNLLSDAITNNLHVIIAIHSPHGGATAKECSFSRYGQGDMPTLTDCNTPQTVIDAVASAISNGLKFIGYLVGHTHQDNIWDAENNGTQLMYCITCAAVSYNGQWLGSDLYRNYSHDAFNVVSIDTAHTLVKLIRGGGADIDNHMRTRKAICFDYSTGEVVGEVL